MKWKPVHVDGALWVSIGLFTAMLAGLNSDDAYKYCNPYVLFWVRWFLTSVNGAAMALKMYRSTAYARSQDDEKASLTNGKVKE